jgi:CRP-like cAMP-binding protein
MHDTHPIRRYLSLRQFAPLARIELAELAMVADNVVEATFPPGAVVAARGARVPAVHLIVDGRVDAGGVSWEPHDVFGLLEVLAGRAPTTTAVAAVETHTFAIGAGDFREVLEDNFGLMRGVVRGLARQLAADGYRSITTAPAIAAGGPLSFVERLIVLRRHVPFIGGRLQALAALAQSLEERRWMPGETIVTGGTAADASIMIVDGTVRLASADREIAATPTLLGPGESIGAFEALAGTRHACDVVATSPTFTLACPAPAIFDVLEDHTDLALSMVAVFARRLLDSAIVAPIPARMYSLRDTR